MIEFSLFLNNPFYKSQDNHFLWYKNGSFTKNKHWEIQATSCKTLIGIAFYFTMRQSHAGFRIEFGLLGNNISFEIYDHRHWNDATNSWDLTDSPA